MSVEAITWALRQPVPASSAKFVLVVLANCADAVSGLAYPSIAYISDSTGQDRKTVVSNLKRLVEWGLIEDTGKRSGRTKQIVVYRVRVDLRRDATLMESHYCYRCTDPATGQYYIGVRSCIGDPSKDAGYVGSGRWVQQAVHGGVTLRKSVISEFPSRTLAEEAERSAIAECIDDPLCMNRVVPPNSAGNGTVANDPENGTLHEGGNGTVFPSKEYRFSPERVPKTGHGTVRNRKEPISLSPACAGEAELPEVVVTDGDGNPIVSVIAELTAEQSAHLVKTCRALHKMGSRNFNVGDEKLAALFRERFTAEQVVRCAGEKALRDAGLWNDPDLSPDLIDLLINGGTQRDMGLTDKQHVALRSAVSQVSIGYVAAALRGRRRDAATPTGTTHANQAIQRGPGGRGNSLAERVKANALSAERRGRSLDGSTEATRDI